jgi:hypothetical protein
VQPRGDWRSTERCCSATHGGESGQFATQLSDLGPGSPLTFYESVFRGKICRLEVYQEKIKHFSRLPLLPPTANPGRTRRNCQLPGRSLREQLPPTPLPTEEAEGTSPRSENDGTHAIADDHCLSGGVQLLVPKLRDSLFSEPEVGLQPNAFRRRSFLPAARLFCKMLCVPSSCALIQKSR